MIPIPVRIIYLIGELGLGGSERQLFLLLKHMDKTRFEPHVVVFNPSPHIVLDSAIESLGISVIHVPPDRRTVLQRFIFLVCLFLRIQPHVVHSWTIHDNTYAGLAGWLAAVPLRWGSVRGSLQLIGFRSLPFFYRWLSLHSVSRLVVNAQTLVDELLSASVNSNRVLLLQNCIESGSAPSSTLPPDLNLSADSVVIGTVGNLRRVKNHEIFIRAIAQLIMEFPALRGLIVGQTVPYEAELLNQLLGLIKELGLEKHVILTGFHDDVPNLMRCFSVFCLTSDSEGTPNVLLEAMSAKCAIVATNVGGIPALIQSGITGILVPPGNVDAVADALRTLLRNPNMRCEIGQAAYNAIESFDCDRVCRVLCNLYESALFQLK